MSSTTGEGAEDVNDFLLRIRELGEKRDKEDEERTKKLEEEILQSRKERQARRAERARSISPTKDSPVLNPARLSTASSRAIDPPENLEPTSFSSTLDTSPTSDVSHDDEATRADDSVKESPKPDETAPTSPTRSPLRSRTGTLSWQQRPASREFNRYSFMSTSPTRSPTRQNRLRTMSNVSNRDQEPSHSQSTPPSPSKDTSASHQTADKGLESPSAPKSGAPSLLASPTLGSSQNPADSSQENTTELEKEGRPEESRSPSRASSTFAESSLGQRYSSVSSVSTATGLGSPAPLSNAPKLEPSTIESTHEEQMPTSPSQRRRSPERPSSPTKGMGGFVQSAMLKRSDSVSKRWSAQLPQGLARGNSLAGNRNSIAVFPQGDALSGLSGSPPKLGRDGPPSPRHRPSSSHSEATVVNPNRANDRPATPPVPGNDNARSGGSPHRPHLSLHMRSPSTLSRDEQNQDSASPASASTAASRTMDSRRWSPTKASWLESALNRPDSPRHKKQPSQPAPWIRERQSRGSVDLGRKNSFKEVTPVGLMRSPAPGTHIKKESVSGIPDIFAKLDSPKTSRPTSVAKETDLTSADQSTREPPTATGNDSQQEPEPVSSAEPAAKVEIEASPSTAEEKAPETSAEESKETAAEERSDDTTESTGFTEAVTTEKTEEINAESVPKTSAESPVKPTETTTEAPAETTKAPVETPTEVAAEATTEQPKERKLAPLSLSTKSNLGSPSESPLSPRGPISPKPKTQSPMIDFRANLRRREAPKDNAQKAEPEFKNVFGKLKKTETVKHEIPNELKDNILRGKAGLNASGGPKKSERVDELKESILKQKEAMKASGGSVRRNTAGEKDAPAQVIPEAIAKRQHMSKSSSVKSNLAAEAQSPLLSPSEPGTPRPSCEQQLSPQLKDTSVKDSESPRVSESLEDESTAGKSVQEEQPLSPQPQDASAKGSENSEVSESPEAAFMMSKSVQEEPELSPEPQEITSVEHSESPDVPEFPEAVPTARKSVQEEPQKEVTEVADLYVPASKNESKAEDLDEKIEKDKLEENRKSTEAIKPVRDLPSETPTETANAPPPAEGLAKGNKLAGRINPALAGLLSRGPPVANPATNKSLPTQASKEKSSEPVAPLSHMTKGRARGPKRRMPTTVKADADIDTPPATATAAPVDEPATVPAAAATIDEPAFPETASIDEQRSEPSISPVEHSIVESSNWPLPSPVTAVEPTREQPTESKPTELRRSLQTGVRNELGQKSENVTPKSVTGLNKLPSRPAGFSHEDIENLGDSPSNKPAVPPKQPSPSPVTPVPAQKRSSQIQYSSPSPSPLRTSLKENSPASPQQKSVAGSFISGARDMLSRNKALPSPPVPQRMSDISLGQQSPRSSSSLVPQADETMEVISDFFKPFPHTSDSVDIDPQLMLTSKVDDLKIRTLKKQIWEITSDGTRQDLPINQEYILYEGSMYLCVHVFESDGGTQSEAHLWCGDDVGDSAVDNAQSFARKVAKENSCKLEVIKQGKETTTFIQALGGILITRRGSNSRSSSSALYMLCGRKHLKQMVFDEVDLSRRNLCSGFPFVISAMFGKLYLWKGNGSSAEEIGAARLIGMDLGLTGEIEEVTEGEEPEGFDEIFTDLNDTGKYMFADYWKLKPNHDQFRARLLQVDHGLGQRSSFWMRRTGSSSPIIRPNDTIQEVEPFCHKDLLYKGIYILDIFYEIYVIVGEQASNRPAEFASAVVFAHEYGILAASLQDRPFIPKSFVSIGGIPDSCRSAFRKWDKQTWQTPPQVFPLNAAIEAIRS